MKKLLSKFKECLSKFLKTTQALYNKWFRKTKQDSMSDKQDSMSDKQDSMSDKQGIPLDEAFRMWKEEQSKKK